MISSFPGIRFQISVKAKRGAALQKGEDCKQNLFIIKKLNNSLEIL